MHRFKPPTCYGFEDHGKLTLPEASESDDEPVMMKFPTAERNRPKAAPQPIGKIKRHKVLGGLLSHYECVAA